MSWLLLECCAQRCPIGGDHLDLPWQLVEVGAIEEPTVVGEAHVGQQYAGVSVNPGQYSGDIGGTHEAGDARVAPEVQILDGMDGDIGTIKAADEGRNDPSAEFAREDVNRSPTVVPA
jgi:hypothetical protein